MTRAWVIALIPGMSLTVARRWYVASSRGLASLFVVELAADVWPKFFHLVRQRVPCHLHAPARQRANDRALGGRVVQVRHALHAVRHRIEEVREGPSRWLDVASGRRVCPAGRSHADRESSSALGS